MVTICFTYETVFCVNKFLVVTICRNLMSRHDKANRKYHSYFILFELVVFFLVLLQMTRIYTVNMPKKRMISNCHATRIY